jgi:hypothetical protein
MQGISATAISFELRTKLQQITDTYVGERIGEQPRLIAELSALHPHSITLLERKEAGPKHRNSLQFNCHEYAFGLRGSQKVARVSFVYQDIFPGEDFVTWLINNVLTQKLEDKLRPGDVVVYTSDTEVAHSGIWANGRVRSKWGSGHLWEHGLYELPLSYGSKYCFFEALSGDVSEDMFLKYTKIKGHELYPNTFEWPFD